MNLFNFLIIDVDVDVISLSWPNSENQIQKMTLVK